MVPTHRSWPDSQEANVRILYVGRDEGLLVALRRVLREPQYLIVSCMDRGSAILFLRGDPKYDLLLFDFELLCNKGLEIVRLAQSLPHRQRTPIIITTAKGMTGNLEKRARRAGVKECLVKTGEVVELSQAIMRFLERSHRDS
ncbi:MAG: response regulator [Acidobacteria bacterium]|nr:response regulator [Acidobacteriota bacterium]